MRKDIPRIIHFVNGSNPSQEDKELTSMYGPGVVFRNARMVPADQPRDSVEKCDGVSGAVPLSYAHLPTADAALAAFRKRFRGEAPALTPGGSPKPATPAPGTPNDVAGIVDLSAVPQPAATGWASGPGAAQQLKA